MPNILITPNVIAKLAYANLYAATVMAGLVHRDFESDFRGAVGDTITVRKPAMFEAKEFNRATGIEIQDAGENSFTVKLDTLLDVSFAVTAEDLTMEVADFNEQFVVPAMEAIRQGIDRKILTLRADIVQEVGHGAGLEPYDDPRSLIDAGVVLTERKVPFTDRHTVVGPRTSGAWTKDPLFHQADQRGDTEGLREASIGRKFGFDNYTTQNVDPPQPPFAAGEPTSEENVAFHRTAFAFVSRALALPKGTDKAAVFGDQGYGVRVVQAYDINLKQDVVSLDVLIGVKTLDANRAVLIKAADQA